MPVFKSLSKYYRAWRTAASASRLENREISILSNNCCGGFIYKDMKLQFLSPTIGLFFFTPDYIRFLSGLDRYLGMDLSFTRESRFNVVPSYPIGLLDDIEIHFTHYRDQEHARAKWNERKTRIRKDRLFVVGAEVLGCTPEHVRDFDALPFAHKVFFTKYAYPQYKNALQLKRYEKQEFEEYLRWRGWVGYIDLVKWFNGAPDYRK